MMKIKQNYLLKKILVGMLLICIIHSGTNAQKVLSAPTNSQITSNPQLKADQFSRVKMMLQRDTKTKTLTDTKSKGVARPNYYTFTGKGSWFTPSNWENNLVPPSILKPGDHIII